MLSNFFFKLADTILKPLCRAASFDGTDNLPIEFLGCAASNGVPQSSRRNVHIYLRLGYTFAVRPCHAVPRGIVWTYLNFRVDGATSLKNFQFFYPKAAISPLLSYTFFFTSGLFHRAISQSGTALAPWVITPRMLAKNRTNALGILTGCPLTSSELLVTCLREIPAEELLHVYPRFYVILDLIIFYPVRVHFFRILSLFFWENCEHGEWVPATESVIKSYVKNFPYIMIAGRCILLVYCCFHIQYQYHSPT